MKRNLLAIAIPALLAAGAANASIAVWNQDGNKINVDGRIKAATHITKIGNNKGDHSEARAGFTAETQISDTLTGYARASWQTSSSAYNPPPGFGQQEQEIEVWKTETRYAFAGLNFGNIGSIDYGKNDGLIKGISHYTDVLPEFGGDSTSRGYYILANRTKALATYRNNNLFGLVDGMSFALQYADRVSEEKYSRRAYAASVNYALLDTGISIAGGYARTAGSDYNQTWATGLKYDANNLLLAANYFQAKDEHGPNQQDPGIMKRYWGFEVVAQYGFDFEVGRLTPSVAYIQHKEKDQDNGDLVKYVDVGATYQFNQNIAAVVDYKINLLKDKDLGGKKKKAHTKNSVGIGLIYQF